MFHDAGTNGPGSTGWQSYTDPRCRYTWLRRWINDLLALRALAEEGSRSEEEPLRERVLAALTEPQRKMVVYRWNRKSGASFDAIIRDVPGAFRQVTLANSATITDKVKRIRQRPEKANLRVQLEVSGQRLRLVFLPG